MSDPKTIEQRRIDQALLYMAQVKQPNIHTLEHLRGYLTGQYDSWALTRPARTSEEKPEGSFVPAPRRESKLCNSPYYDTGLACVRAKGHPCWSVDGIGHTLSPEHKEK